MLLLNLAKTIESLSQTPNKVREITDGIESNHQTWKPSQEQFSILENVCHLRDIETEAYIIRINRILTEELPLLLDVDGTRLAQERQYNSYNLNSALEEFRLARSSSIKSIEGLTPEMLEQRSGNLEYVGIISLRQLIEKMIEHDSDHLKELEKLRNELLVKN